MKTENDLSILIKLNPSGWVRRIYVVAGNDRSERVVTRTLNRILKRSCQGWMQRLITRAGAMF